jgi:hypothetical protein
VSTSLQKAGLFRVQILTALTLRAVFRLPFRQTEGLIGSVIGLLGLDLAVPDHGSGKNLGQLACAWLVGLADASPQR